MNQVIILAEGVGLPGEYLYQLAQEGVIERVSRRLYQWPGRDSGRHHSVVELGKLAPRAVDALLSALNFHELTPRNLFEVWLAIDRKAWRPEISFPPVRYVTTLASLPRGLSHRKS